MRSKTLIFAVASALFLVSASTGRSNLDSSSSWERLDGSKCSLIPVSRSCKIHFLDTIRRHLFADDLLASASWAEDGHQYFSSRWRPRRPDRLDCCISDSVVRLGSAYFLKMREKKRESTTFNFNPDLGRQNNMHEHNFSRTNNGRTSLFKSVSPIIDIRLVLPRAKCRRVRPFESGPN